MEWLACTERIIKQKRDDLIIYLIKLEKKNQRRRNLPIRE
jgi:hypothetical protein